MAGVPPAPKGPGLTVHDADTLAAVAFALNTRPRKTLGWKAPAEALDEQLKSFDKVGMRRGCCDEHVNPPVMVHRKINDLTDHCQGGGHDRR